MSDTPNALADELLTVTLTREPLWATILGIPGHDTDLADRSAAADDTVRARCLDLAARAEAIDPAPLTADEEVTRAVVAHQARSTVDELDGRGVEYAISDLFVSPVAELLHILPMVVLGTGEQVESYLERLRAVPAYLDTVARRHREGVAAGRVPVARLVRSAVAHLDRHLADTDTDPLARQPLTGDAADRRAALLADVVRPALAGYRHVLDTEIAPHGRDDQHPGLCWLPDGDAMYAGLARHHTTTDRDPDELHRTGLELIEALTEEYAETGARVFGTRDRAEIFARMSGDPAMRWRDGDELLDAARDAVVRAEAALPGYFGRLPATRCAIEPIPAADAPGAPAAYYVMPSLDGSRAGTYFANTDRATERDRFAAEVVAFHEAVPGHHLQIALAQELTHLPLLRRVATPNAYAEGWGLYTERLADEMGLYSSDVMRLGMLAMDSMRAGRLVVDTGLHAKGWSRERAVTFLRDNTPMSDLEIGNETDRYTVYAGQALSYMVGRLELQSMRAQAQARPDFDLKAFHDTVLGSGPLPLTVLRTVVSRP
ncbi:hypothetical protein BLA60_26645 [Actinophytocola xinjiangensis]|uniref:DUF885 domain-containing protein n=1 Tax=Actinophytocola xinjiangensis TaxID=485602 RepID=A0A7Z0WJC6_9PSEU|nr:DUF885 domain-containing protein [Actinophytocola xinjiangensis]OLF07507.1 hypothetical protein BLA60_26645 [Actinophytocola xinjiangensis]